MATSKTKKQPVKRPIAHRSFKVAKETEPFLTFRFTQQTTYWLILCGIVLALGAWVMYLTLKVHGIYDEVEPMSSTRIVHPMARH